MYHAFGQPQVDLTGYPCLNSDLCKSAGDAGLMCCASIPGAPGGTCRTRDWCSSAGYEELIPPSLPGVQPQSPPPSVGMDIAEQIVVGVAVAVGVGLVLSWLKKATGKSYVPNPSRLTEEQKERRKLKRRALVQKHTAKAKIREWRLKKENTTGARWLAKSFGLNQQEAIRLLHHPRQRAILAQLDDWRDEHGFPAKNSPLVRGKLLEMMEYSQP